MIVKVNLLDELVVDETFLLEGQVLLLDLFHRDEQLVSV